MKLLPRHPCSGRRTGLTSVEIAVSMVVLLVALGGAVSSIFSSVLVGKSAHESSVAALEVQRAVERMRSQDFGEIFARYNANPADDPDGPGTAVGAAFDIPGLRPVEGDADGRVGEILFPVDAATGELSEAAVFAGITHDLDGDGAVTVGDLADSYVVLPVRVRAEWTGASGSRQIEIYTVFTSR